ncbi:MAG: hypothetical protein FJW39_24775 [Acidobacteria bacterium]|nr:hypothetical protein [Acidobacteriota bacterium]
MDLLMLSGLLRHLDASRHVACPEARYNALLYARSRDLPHLEAIANPEASGGAVEAEIAAVDEGFDLVDGSCLLQVGDYVAVNSEGFVSKIAVRAACPTMAHQWLSQKDELGYTAEDFAMCAVSRYEISVDLLTPVRRPRACAAVLFQSAIVDRLAILTKAVIFDVDACRFTSPVRRRFPDAAWPVDIREHVGFQLTRAGDGMRVRTRGMVKFGCPELEAAQIPEQYETIQLVSTALADLAQQIAIGSSLDDGEPAATANRLADQPVYVF